LHTSLLAVDTQGVQKRKKKPAKTIASLDSLAAELNHITTSAAAAAAAGGSAADAQLSELQQARLLAGKGTESSIKRSKARLAMGVTESARLQRVLQHPAYKADPIQVRPAAGFRILCKGMWAQGQTYLRGLALLATRLQNVRQQGRPYPGETCSRVHGIVCERLSRADIP
jgi:hypothetical protein